nr:hypothetical protein [Mycobacterium tilburgii]
MTNPTPNTARCCPGFGSRGDVTDQSFTQPGQVHRQHDRLSDAGVHGDGGGDLAEFDAEAADLDLLFGAADEFDVPVGVAADREVLHLRHELDPGVVDEDVDRYPNNTRQSGVRAAPSLTRQVRALRRR